MSEANTPSVEKPEPVPEWEAKADAWHEAILVEAGNPNPFDVLTMLETWKSHVEPADSEGRITFSRSLLDSAHDGLKAALELARFESSRLSQLEAENRDLTEANAILNLMVEQGIEAHRGAIAELEAENRRMEAALIRLRDCDWVISLPDRMDAVRDIARQALNKGPDHA